MDKISIENSINNYVNYSINLAKREKLIKIAQLCYLDKLSVSQISGQTQLSANRVTLLLNLATTILKRSGVL